MADWLQHILGLSAHVYYGNSIADWVVAGFVAVSAWLGLSIMRRLLVARSQRAKVSARPTPVRSGG